MACQQGRIFGRVRSSENPIPLFLPNAPSFPRRRESRPLIFRNIQRLPQYGLCPRIWFAEISVAVGLLIYSRGRSPRYVSRFQTPASRLKKQFPHPCQPCRHSREGGNPDLRLSEIFNDGRSVGFAHEYGLQKYQLRRVFIYSRGQSPRYGCRLQIPASRLKKQFPHPCLLRRHSRAGGNPDL